ncbi:MAG TPA: T9SS type A sorting domain-containing protein, partial [Lentimicrobium sp.]|nr:T9SS type A sorting domain-containing protein [Lentimicrobium sp.]
FYFFTIDTSQSNNVWQRGEAQKMLFNNGYQGPKAFITDTVNPYPVNNVSTFEFSMLNCSQFTAAENCGGYWGMGVNLIYMIDSDEEIDGGTIEVSHNGSPFINIIEDPLVEIEYESYSVNDTVLSLGKPGFSGTTYDWQNMNLYFRNYYSEESFDTIILRFTFASDSIQTNKEGWIFGLIDMGGYFESLENLEADKLISVYPNPACDQISVVPLKNCDYSKIQLLSFTGQVLYDNPKFRGDTIDTRQLPDGVYLLKYSDTEYYAVKKVVVHH